jgi:phenylalanyl-tRNA synthetase beta chain
MVGYDLIPETLLEGGLPPQEANPELELERRVQDIMVSCGVDEVITYSVTYSGALRRLAQIEEAAVQGDGSRPRYRSWDPSRPPVTIVNPISVRQDVLRPTLLPNLLDTLRHNLRVRPEEPVRIFELGKIYLTRTEAEVQARKAELAEERVRYPRLQAWEPVPGEERLPLEPRRLAGVMSGPRHPRSLFHPDGDAPAEQLDFFDAKGVVEELLRHLHIEVQWVPADAPLFHPGRVAALRVGDSLLGVVGELHPSVIREWDVPAQRVAAWDLNFEALLRALPERVLYEPVSPYQPVRQDMAFVVRDDISVAAVRDAIRRAGGRSVTDVSLFDIYTGPPVPQGHKSLAFAITFNSIEKPLTEEDVARLRRRIQHMLERELGAKLRS